MNRYAGDLPREKLLEVAQQALDDFDGKASVNFKFTCQACGERCVLAETNMLRENGECHKCGAVTQINEGGFILILSGSRREKN